MIAKQLFFYNLVKGICIWGKLKQRKVWEANEANEANGFTANQSIVHLTRKSTINGMTGREAT